MAVDMKQVYRSLLEEAFGKGNLQAFDELCDPGYRSHDPVTGDSDLAREKENCRMYRAAFPDLSPTVLASYVDGDTVITRWRMTGTHQGSLMGIPATGRRCTADGTSIARCRGGKIAEDWVMWDALGLMRQLGAAPSAEAGASSRAPEGQPRV